MCECVAGMSADPIADVFVEKWIHPIKFKTVENAAFPGYRKLPNLLKHILMQLLF